MQKQTTDGVKIPVYTSWFKKVASIQPGENLFVISAKDPVFQNEHVVQL